MDNLGDNQISAKLVFEIFLDNFYHSK